MAIFRVYNILIFLSIIFVSQTISAEVYPLDGLSPAEYKKIKTILTEKMYIDKNSLFPLIELIEPEKSVIKSYKKGSSVDRRVLVNFSTDSRLKTAVVNLTRGKVEKVENLNSQPMITLKEFLSAMKIALNDKKMISGLAKRGLKADEVFCLPLTAGNFFTPEEKGKRLMKVPCYVQPGGSNFYAKPIEGLFALVDLKSNSVLKVNLLKVNNGIIVLHTALLKALQGNNLNVNRLFV